VRGLHAAPPADMEPITAVEVTNSFRLPSRLRLLSEMMCNFGAVLVRVLAFS